VAVVRSGRRSPLLCRRTTGAASISAAPRLRRTTIPVIPMEIGIHHQTPTPRLPEAPPGGTVRCRILTSVRMTRS